MPQTSNTACARCGDCCENIWLGFDPDGIRKRLDGKNAVDANFINDHWIFQGPDPKGGYRYECTKFDPVSRLCTAHDDRPPVCSNYPYYGKDTITKETIPYACSYQADLRTNLPIVAITGP